ncbi:MAG: long-chain fatty acid--CoA ligase, partial [Candidatus Melainabacteria bacterium]|nr:long-chain fatty acid--CoA ligase [Candidatus Melainabacteria bacterium]
GVPKGAVHDLGSLVQNVWELGEEFGLSETDSAFLPLPLSHIFGMVALLAGFLFRGVTVLSEFSPAYFWDSILRLRATMVVGVPTMYSALVNMSPLPTSQIPVQFYLSGGAPLPNSLAREFKTRFGKQVIEGYGTTETKIISFNADGPIGSVGRPLPSVRIDIVDENDQVLSEAAQGEIRVTSPNLMQTYLNQPEATRAVLHEGHYHTGDIGYLKDGFLFISGRSKDMIIVAGNKVFPAEVESVLRQSPLVSEVAVFGVPHRKLGQLVKAAVVVKPGELCDLLCGDVEAQKVGRQELLLQFKAFCKQHLKRELRPMEWEFRPSSCPLPKTFTGKIDKKQLYADA